MDTGSLSARIAASMTQVAASLQVPVQLSETLDLITHSAASTIPGVDEASVSLTTRDHRIETLAPTDDLVLKADEQQYALGEGPCLEAALDEPIVHALDLATDERWPRYGPAAVSLGFGSQLAFQFRADPHIRGALNLYGVRPYAIQPEVYELGGMFAGQIALAMGWARHDETMHEALATRNLIGQAVGIVMERYELDPDRAFAFLIRSSQTANLKLRVVAEGVVDEVVRRARG